MEEFYGEVEDEVFEFQPIFFVFRGDYPCVGFALNAFCHPELIRVGALVEFLGKIPELVSVPITVEGRELYPITIGIDPFLTRKRGSLPL